MKSGFLFGGPQASHLSLPWREGSQVHAERKGSKCPSTPPSSHISENLVLNCSTHVRSFGPLSVEHQLPPGMKRNDFRWPGCPMLSPRRGHPSQYPKPLALRQIWGIPNAVRSGFVESLSNILAHVCYFWDCFHNPFKTQKCLRKCQGSFFLFS